MVQGVTKPQCLRDRNIMVTQNCSDCLGTVTFFILGWFYLLRQNHNKKQLIEIPLCSLNENEGL